MTTTLGISFSSQRCHAILLRENNGNFFCLAKRLFDVEFNNKNDASKIRNALKPLCQKKPSIIIGIPFGQTMLQQVTVDATLSQDDLLAFLNTTITQLFGQPANALRWDYETRSLNNTRQEITIAATPKILIDQLQELFNDDNVTITAIEPDAFSFSRLITPLLSEKTGYALIEREDCFLFLSAEKGRLKQCETISSLEDIHLLSPILSKINAGDQIIIIANNPIFCEEKLQAILQQPDITITLLSPNTLFQIHDMDNIDDYIAAIALCSWKKS